MLLPSSGFDRRQQIQERDDDPEERITSGPSYVVWIGIGAIAISLILAIFLIKCARHRRARSSEPPLLLPKFLHKAWRSWRPPNYAHIPTPLEDQQRQRSTTTSSSMRTPSLRGGEENDTVDRRISVRSIMTLPEYRREPRPTEQLIAREGERAGVDTVVEFPETENEAENRREEEMSTLYNIRQARRREQAEREERRRARREAREAGNWARLEELERASRQRAQQRRNNEASMLARLQDAEARGEFGGLPEADSNFLIAELQSLRERNSRTRRVSSVSYADLGTARHDGSRIRAGSFESDNLPLLEEAASLGGQRSRATSRASSAGHRRPSLTRPGTAHTRNTSAGGASYLSDEDNDDNNDVTTTNASGFRSSSRIGAGQALLSPRSQVSLRDAPPPYPPSYEDDEEVHAGEAPPYESPVDTRNPQGFRREENERYDPMGPGPVRRGTDEELRDGASAAARFLERSDGGGSGSGPGSGSGSGSGGRGTGIVGHGSDSSSPTDDDTTRRFTPQGSSTEGDSPVALAASSSSSHHAASASAASTAAHVYDEAGSSSLAPGPVLNHPSSSSSAAAGDHRLGKKALPKLKSRGLPPSIEINSATPVSSAQTSPRSIRSFRAER